MGTEPNELRNVMSAWISRVTRVNARALSATALLCVIQCLWVTDTAAQQHQIPRRVVFIVTGTSPQGPEARAFHQELHELGYKEGRDVVVEWAAERDYVRASSLVTAVVRTKPDVIVIDGTLTVRAAKQATTTIPIVIAVSGDPLASGLVDSLARPGGNITGLSMMMVEIAGKRLQLLKEAMPGLRRLGVLWDPSVPWHSKAVDAIAASARSMGVQVTAASAQQPAELDTTLAILQRDHPQALYVLESALFVTRPDEILGYAAKLRIPTMIGWRAWVLDGALLSYSADLAEMFRRSAWYVDKILKGAKPGDLPLEQPTKFELFVNLRTAKALGLMIPESLLVRADGVIR